MTQQLPVKFNNYEDCLVGVAQSHNDVVYLYDKEKILDKIKDQLKCDHKTAIYFFDQNINKDYGKRSPMFLCKINFIDV